MDELILNFIRKKDTSGPEEKPQKSGMTGRAGNQIEF